MEQVEKPPTKCDTEELKPPSPDFEKANKTLFNRMCLAYSVDPEKQTVSPYLQSLIEAEGKQKYEFYVSESLEEIIKRKGWSKA